MRPPTPMRTAWTASRLRRPGRRLRRVRRAQPRKARRATRPWRLMGRPASGSTRTGSLKRCRCWTRPPRPRPNPFIGDAARLKSALALLDTAPYAEIESRLKPLTDPKRPYAALAREALAMAKLKAGKTQDALGDFQVLQLMADAPEDVRQRAGAAAAARSRATTPRVLPPPSSSRRPCRRRHRRPGCGSRPRAQRAIRPDPIGGSRLS